MITDLGWKNHEMVRFGDLPKVTNLRNGWDRKTKTNTVSREPDTHILPRSLIRPNMTAGNSGKQICSPESQTRKDECRYFTFRMNAEASSGYHIF